MSTDTQIGAVSPVLDDYELNDRYRREEGRVFLTGTQALVSILLMQRRSDRKKGLNTAGFISGYRGSPLGGVDQALWRADKFLKDNDIKFLPAINEDLAATAVLGTQQVETEKDPLVDGVFSMWYGKGPGVDRAGDALKHGNGYGSSPNGGVLVVVGDDHGCVSSSMSHQSDVALMAWYMPTLNPASLSEYIEFGLYGYALSRYSGMWVGFKGISETVESAASVEMPDIVDYNIPTDFEMPEGGLNYRWPDLPGMQIESRMKGKVKAVRAFARANPIDRTVFNNPEAKFGIITTGKAYLDVMEALAQLDIDEARAREIGIDIYKVGMVWPLETQGAQRFMAGKDEILVVEEKRGIIESQLKEYLYDRDVEKPKRILGKHDENGDTLISWVDELSPSILAPILADRIAKLFGKADFKGSLCALEEAGESVAAPAGAKRVPYFCSGCPHNTSTKVPEGSRALAGIGCHFMASWMNRDTTDLIQMGGEGVNWASKSMFLKEKHIFQNLGDGTYYHSGFMAIRQAIAAKTNITYKILYNDAVAMTGGQPVDGILSVGQMASELKAEGVKKVVIVSDNPEQMRKLGGYPAGTGVFHRDDMDAVQRDLREIEGTTVLIYEQTCAAEKRRRRKRGTYPDPAKRIFINDLVCEGCGDCGKQSNCLSIIPKETPLGRKRAIDQSSCNKDYSCVKGFCPSFVSVEGGELKKPETRDFSSELTKLVADLPEPSITSIDRSYDLLVGGVGGTGVVTIGAIITMAAHLEGKGASVLDFMGFAQKGGTVLSYVRLGEKPENINQVRIDNGAASAVIVCDLVVGTDQRSLNVMQSGKTRVTANTEVIPTADFIKDRNIDFGQHLRLKTLKDACGTENVSAIDASAIARRLLGDLVFSNMFLLGYSWQQGLVPVSFDAIDRAITLNGVAVDKNKQAFALGRAAAVDANMVNIAAGIVEAPAKPETLEEIVSRRSAFLTDYQNVAYAQSYESFVTEVASKTEGLPDGDAFAQTTARYLFKLMAYKDEYEVARLYTDGQFKEKLSKEFTGNFKIKFNMAPPIFNRGLDADGRPRKSQFGGWMMPVFKVMARMRVLRGTKLDVFGMTEERRMERRLITEYKQDIMDIVSRVNAENMPTALRIAALPDDIRGFGPVKEESVEKVSVRRERLLKEFDGAQPAANVA
ncbi:indolepyruvate ferredoxin oxidoreductase family protein [Kordiimonas aquimaris]|uniref:indolepyruvate ferredoxin oxidoreductase family protein n=1 Tax=Kordiimonas aquimaris TaxID=707591 RepID=UPI0021D2A8A9|nr:indolepyruvate ferredoxin oxidoreductase family protein [Kordiimonas aquimaris]